MTLDKFGPSPDFPEDRFGRKMFGGDGGNGGKSFPMFCLKIGAAEQPEMIDILQMEIDTRDNFESFLPVVLVQRGPGSIRKILGRSLKGFVIGAYGHAGQPISCTGNVEQRVCLR